MGIWNTIRKGKPTILPEYSNQAIVPKETFKDRIRREGQENLSPDQLREIYAQAIGIDSELLRLPGVKDVLFTLFDFEMIQNNIGFDTRIKNAQKCYNIERRTDGKVTIVFEYGYRRDTVEITRAESSYTIRKTEQSSDVSRSEEERRYDMHTGIETYRKESRISLQQGTIFSEIFTRDSNSLEKVNYIKTKDGSLLASGIQDISYEDEDIATLDGTRMMEHYKEYENSATRNERVLKKIACSKNAKGCYEYSGMVDPNLQVK